MNEFDPNDIADWCHVLMATYNPNWTCADGSVDHKDGTLGKEIDTVIDALRGGIVPGPKVDQIIDAAAQSKRDRAAQRAIRI
jgi:hypothetical protein